MSILKNRNAEGYILPCVVTVILCMIAATVIFYTATVSMIMTQKEDTKKVLDSFVTENAIEIYDSVKVGNDTQYELDSSAFTEKLLSFCSLNKSGDTLYSYDESGNLRYKLSNPKLTADKNLKVTATYTLSVPIYFNGAQVSIATIPISINAYYTEKF